MFTCRVVDDDIDYLWFRSSTLQLNELRVAHFPSDNKVLKSLRSTVSIHIGKIILMPVPQSVFSRWRGSNLKPEAGSTVEAEAGGGLEG